MAELDLPARPARPAIRSLWFAPFQWLEWGLRWMIYWFKGIALFEFLEYLGKLTILFGAIAYLYEAPERRRKAVDDRKRAQYEAWMIVNSAKGEGGDGGRRLAISDLHQAGASLLGLAAEEAYLDGLDLSGADLRRARLRWADLQNVRLNGSDLKNADLRNADLRNADLGGASLVGADLRNSRLQNANLAGADLSEADVTGAILQGPRGLTPAQLRAASHHSRAILDRDFGRAEGLEPLDLSGLDFSKLDLRYADLAGRLLARSRLEGCNLNGVDLAGADLNGADLNYASLRGANLGGAKLRKATFLNANQPVPPWLDPKAGPSPALIMPSPQSGGEGQAIDPRAGQNPGGKATNFRAAELRGATFGNANLEDADFSDADLSGVDFSAANLHGAVFRNANLSGAKLNYCQNLTEDQARSGRNWETASYDPALAVKLGLLSARQETEIALNNSMAPSKMMPMPAEPSDGPDRPGAEAPPEPMKPEPPEPNLPVAPPAAS